MLLPSNPYTPQEKTVITEIVITVIQIIFKNPWWFQNKVVYLRSKRNVAAITHKIINGMARYIDHVWTGLSSVFLGARTLKSA